MSTTSNAQPASVRDTADDVTDAGISEWSAGRDSPGTAPQAAAEVNRQAAPSFTHRPLHRAFPLFTLHSSGVLSSPRVASVPPSDGRATALTAPLCPCRRCGSSPLRASQSLAALSPLPLTRPLPSGVNATEVTGPAAPSRGTISALVTRGVPASRTTSARGCALQDEYLGSAATLTPALGQGRGPPLRVPSRQARPGVRPAHRRSCGVLGTSAAAPGPAAHG